MSNVIKVPIAEAVIGRTKNGELVYAADEFRRFFEYLAEGTGRSTSGFIDADLIGIPSYDMLAQIVMLQDRVISLEGRLNERDTSSNEQILDLAAIAQVPQSGLQGPGSSTDNAAARWDGSTGQRLQDSLFLIDDAGHVSSFGGNIKFPAEQVPSADVNTCDDYEEVAITPTVAFGGGATGVTYSVQTGSGVKIGRRFFFQAYVALSANGTSTGAFKVVLGGAPAAKTTANLVSAVAVRAAGLTGVSGGIQGFVESAANTVALSYSATGTATDLSDTTVTDTASFIVSGHYETEN